MSPDLVPLPPPDPTPPEKNATTPSVAITMSQVKPRPLEWLWPGWLAAGKLAVVDGDPEQGKAFVLLDIAARLSRGAPMPDEGGDAPHPNPPPPVGGGQGRRPAVDVTMLTAEDSLEDTVFPRLQAAGADLSRIHVLRSIPPPSVSPPSVGGRYRAGCRQRGRPPRLPKDLPLVEEIIRQTNSRLLVIEPSLADLDRHCLPLLADFADCLRCAVVVQRYLNKMSGTRAVSRGSGGMSVVGAARTALLLARDPREDAIRILALNKTSFGLGPPSLRFVLEPISPGVCRVNWLGTSPLSADDLLAMQAATETKTAIAAAMKFLKEFLQDGPKATELCYAEARNQQISEITLRRARARLEIICNQPRDLLGLFVPATWELRKGSEDQPPHSVINGSTDESDRLKSISEKELQ